MEKDFVCIACPVGCRLHVTQTQDGIKVEGNACRRGETYGRQEFSAPERVVTSTVKIEGHPYEMCPVKTAAPVPKEMVSQVLEAIYQMRAKLPVHVGDIIEENVCDTGVNVVATANIE